MAEPQSDFAAAFADVDFFESKEESKEPEQAEVSDPVEEETFEPEPEVEDEHQETDEVEDAGDSDEVDQEDSEAEAESGETAVADSREDAQKRINDINQKANEVFVQQQQPVYEQPAYEQPAPVQPAGQVSPEIEQQVQDFDYNSLKGQIPDEQFEAMQDNPEVFAGVQSILRAQLQSAENRANAKHDDLQRGYNELYSHISEKDRAEKQRATEALQQRSVNHLHENHKWLYEPASDSQVITRDNQQDINSGVTHIGEPRLVQHQVQEWLQKKSPQVQQLAYRNVPEAWDLVFDMYRSEQVVAGRKMTRAKAQKKADRVNAVMGDISSSSNTKRGKTGRKRSVSKMSLDEAFNS